MASKKQLNRKTKSTKQSAFNIAEQNFQQAKNTITKQCTKEIAAITQQITKCTNQLKKANTTKQQAKDKHAACVRKCKSNPTPAAQKQITAAKKVCEQTAKTAANIQQTITDLKAQQKTLQQCQKKYTALCKTINEFEKSWEKQANSQNKPKKKSSKKAIAKKANDRTTTPFNFETGAEDHPSATTTTLDVEETESVS